MDCTEFLFTLGHINLSVILLVERFNMTQKLEQYLNVPFYLATLLFTKMKNVY